ncbi:hypothetical protein [Streptomyces sp. NPDC093111]|uniref:hypothetical protein n=1 Tax=Streptomyces sp. NPDC093111 TaxID=3154978 RepID=UPI00341B36FF
MASLRTLIRATVAVVAVIAGFAVSPAQAASDGPERGTAPASVTHKYNPNAPLGTADNPVILDGQDQALLSRGQMKNLIAAREARTAQARTRGSAGLAAGCVIGAYWSKCYQVPNFGSLNLASELGSDHHEYIRQQGWLYDTSQTYKTYMDRSANGGASWDGQWGLVLNNRGWGDELFDGPPYVARGCLYSYTTNLIYCTPWH